MDFLGGLLSAGSSLISGLFGQSSQDKALAQQRALNDQNIALQKEFAQNGLQWRAADATAAQTASGINRLALLGVPTSSFSNNVGSFPSDSPIGAGIASAGQDIQRAISSYADKNDRRAELSNKLLEAQIANVNSDTVKNQAAASKLVTQAPKAPTPLYSTYVDDKGRTFKLPSKDASSSMQNWASLPAQIPIAITQAGDAIQSEWNILSEPFRNWAEKFGNTPVRGDVGRYAMPPAAQHYVPF